MATTKFQSTTSLHFLLYFFIFFVVRGCSAVYNISSTNPLLKGQTLSSHNEIFELGFFSSNNSQYLYLGIWYKNISPRVVVWVANREKPAMNSTTSLIIGNNANLLLVDGEQDVIWSSGKNFSSDSSVAELRDNGNLVLKDVTSGVALWESFAHPSHVLLPNSTLPYNLKRVEIRGLTSWKSETDPSPGNYINAIVPHVPPQSFIWKGSKPYWRSGPWSGRKFIGMAEMDITYDSDYRLYQGSQGYFFFGTDDLLTYVGIAPEGKLKIMQKSDKGWDVNWEAPKSLCDVYGTCGPNGICIKSEPPQCKCLKGFVPKSQEEWRKGNWIHGCMRTKELSCKNNSSTVSAHGIRTDKFDKMVRVKIPDLHEYVRGDLHEYLRGEGVEGCHQECLNNCSCSAHAFVEGIGCLIWKGDLLDMVQFPSGGEDLFIRVADSEFGEKNHIKLLIIILTSISLTAIISIGVYSLYRHKRQSKTKDSSQEHAWRKDLKERDISDMHFFDIHTILIATDNFSMSNKLGQGGFGPVYKGKLKHGEEIAVKRLSSSSGQGVEEFKNEIVLISKFRHRNLVRLLGCCIEGDEKMLVYEFMVNKSLDTFLFDSRRKPVLDWAQRFNIIQGIARGLLYLHRDSCLRVIHRDLKVSNILLDEKLNPKISDFGLARMFEGTQDLANTHKVVGTLGYMSPEYALGGVFSEKSDVFSFGILLLEIVTGRKASSFSYGDQSQSEGYLAYVWRSWCETKGLSLVDQTLSNSYCSAEVTRCVHVTLLCVQDHAKDRPNMIQVVSMLNSEMELPEPKRPVFALQNVHCRDIDLQSGALFTVCDITDSSIQGR